MLSASRPRVALGGVLVGALLAGLVAPSLAAPASATPATATPATATSTTTDSATAATAESAPSERSGHSTSASFIQVPVGPYDPLTTQRKSLQAVTDPEAGASSLEVVGIFDGLVSSSIDLSSEFSRIDSATSFLTGDEESTLNVIVRGESAGAEKLSVVASSSGAAFTDVSVTSLMDTPTIDLPSLRLLDAAGSGLIAVHENEAGQYIAKRLTYDFAENTSRPAVTLPFSGSPQLFYQGDTGNFFAAGNGAIEFMSLYDPGAATHIPLPGLGQVTAMVAGYAQAVVSDAAGNIATIQLSDMSVISTFALPGAPSSVALSQTLGEVIATSAGTGAVWRYGVDGTQRTTIDLPGAIVQAGSLSSPTVYFAASTFTANVGGTSYRYTMSYTSPYAANFVEPLTATERGAGVTLSFSAKGTGHVDDEPDYQWEYSLDGGKNWAERTQGWDQAIPDIGNVTTPLPELPAPLDGVAPYYRTDAAADGAIALNGISSTWQDVVLPAESYDGLWRIRVMNSSGSTASTPQPVILGEAGEDPTPRFTQQPASTTASMGQEAQFTVAVSGDPAPQISWEIKRAGGSWETLPGSGTTVRMTAEASDHRALIRALAGQGENQLVSLHARLTVLSAKAPELGAAPAHAVEVTDAVFNWQLNEYSHEWATDVFGDAVTESPDQGFDFSGGTGWVAAKTGEAQILWNGTAVYRPYGGMNGLNMTFANPYLAIGTDGRGTLTADMFWNNGGGMGGTGGTGDSGGFHRVVIATYIDALAQVSDGKLTFSGTPEWKQRPYVAPGLDDATEYASSFPRSFVDYLDRGLRGWFLATGSRNEDKSGIPITGTAQVTEQPARTSGKPLVAADPLGDGAEHFAFSGPRLFSHPQDVTVGSGESATLHAAAIGNPAPSVIWQRKTATGWANIDGATSESLRLTKLVEGSYTVRAEFTNRLGTRASKEATVTVNGAPDPGTVTPKPSSRPKAPVAQGEDLTDAQRGTLVFSQSGATVSVAGLQANEWYYGTVYSQPHGLGWERANAGGKVFFTLPNTLQPGTHRVTVQDAEGTLLGWGEVKVPKSNTDGPDKPVKPTKPVKPVKPTKPVTPSTPGTDTPGTSSTDGTNGGTSVVEQRPAVITGDQLAETGSVPPLMWIGAGLLLAAGGAWVMTARARRTK